MAVIPIQPDVQYMPPEDFEPPELKIVIDDPPGRMYCSHEQIKIYPHHRIITCAKCGSTLDPFDHLLAVGRKEGNQLSSIKYLGLQLKRLEEEADKLRKEVASLKRAKSKIKPQ